MDSIFEEAKRIVRENPEDFEDAIQTIESKLEMGFGGLLEYWDDTHPKEVIALGWFLSDPFIGDGLPKINPAIAAVLTERTGKATGQEWLGRSIIFYSAKDKQRLTDAIRAYKSIEKKAIKIDCPDGHIKNDLCIKNDGNETIQKTKTHWIFTFDKKISHLESNLGGLIPLEILLTNPGKEYPASNLRATIAKYQAGHNKDFKKNIDELSIEYAEYDGNDTLRFVLDKTSQNMIEGNPQVVKDAIAKLKDDLEQTDDPTEKTKIQSKIKCLSSSLTKKGLSRTFNSDADRKAISRYTETIKKKIKRQDESLFSHLDAFLTIGAICKYLPDNQRNWEISQ